MKPDQRVYRAGDEQILRQYRLVQRTQRKEKLEKHDLKAATRTENRTELKATESEQDHKKYRKAYRWAESDHQLNELVAKFSSVRPWEAIHEDAVVAAKPEGKRNQLSVSERFGPRESSLTQALYKGTEAELSLADYDDQATRMQEDAETNKQHAEKQYAQQALFEPIANRPLDIRSDSSMQGQPGERLAAAPGDEKSVNELAQERLSDVAREAHADHESGNQNRTIQEHAEDERASGSRTWDKHGEHAVSHEGSNSSNRLIEQRQGRDCEEEVRAEERRSADVAKEAHTDHESGNQNRTIQEHAEDEKAGRRTEENTGESANRADLNHVEERLFQADQEFCFDPEVINMVAQHGQCDAWQQIEKIGQLDRYAPESELARIDLRTGKDCERQQAGKEDLSFYTRSKAGAVEQRNDQPARLQCIVPMAIVPEIAELGALEPEVVEYLQEEYGFLEKHVEHVSGAESGQEIEPVYRFSEAVDHARSMLVIRDEICAERHDRAMLQIERLAAIKQNLLLAAPQTHVAMEYTSDVDSACYRLEAATAVHWEEVALSKGVRTITDLHSAGREIAHQVEEAATKALDVEKCHRVLRIDRDLVSRKERELERAIHDEPPPGRFVTITFIPGKMHPNKTWPPDFTEPVILLDFWQARSVAEFKAKAGSARYDAATIAYAQMIEDRFNDWQMRIDRGHRQLDRALTGDHEREEDLDR